MNRIAQLLTLLMILIAYLGRISYETLMIILMSMGLIKLIYINIKNDADSIANSYKVIFFMITTIFWFVYLKMNLYTAIFFCIILGIFYLINFVKFNKLKEKTEEYHDKISLYTLGILSYSLLIFAFIRMLYY